MEMQETHLKLDKEQLQTVINEHISSEGGLSQIYEMLINGLMLSERSAFLSDQDKPKNKGNGYRKVKRSGIGSRLELSIPRDRLGVFKPVILGLIDQQEERIRQLCFSLYGKGLTTRQIESITEDLYGNAFSKSQVSRITTDFSALVDSWINRDLDQFYPVIFVDAIHIKVRRDTVASEAFYIILGVKQDFTREVIAIVNIPQESATGWAEVLRDIKKRGVKQVELFVCDDLTGLEDAIYKVFKDSRQQSCTLHLKRNLMNKIRRSDRAQFSEELKPVFNPDDANYTTAEAVVNFKSLIAKWSKKYSGLNHYLEKSNLERYFTYLDYDFRIRRMIYTTNWIERLNKSFRRTLKMRNALPSPKAALTLLGYVAMEIEDGPYKYPIRNFKEDEKMNKFTRS